MLVTEGLDKGPKGHFMSHGAVEWGGTTILSNPDTFFDEYDQGQQREQEGLGVC